MPTWSGTAASFVDMNPPGANTSNITAMAELAFRPGTREPMPGTASHAGRGSGTAASFVDLNPPGLLQSELTGTTGQVHVGQAWFGGLGMPACGSDNTGMTL